MTSYEVLHANEAVLALYQQLCWYLFFLNDRRTHNFFNHKCGQWLRNHRCGLQVTQQTSRPTTSLVHRRDLQSHGWTKFRIYLVKAEEAQCLPKEDWPYQLRLTCDASWPQRFLNLKENFLRRVSTLLAVEENWKGFLKHSPKSKFSRESMK